MAATGFIQPYTLFLFANQWLLAWSDWRLLAWMNSPRVKFFLDTHNAPFKPKHRYWTGLLLVARLAVQISLAANVLGNSELDILVISIVVASLFIWLSIWGRPHANNIIGTLEMSFVANLLYLTVTTYYASLTGINSAIFSYISTGVALATFIGIVISHIFQRMRETTLIWTKCQKTETDNPSKAILCWTKCPKTEHDHEAADTDNDFLWEDRDREDGDYPSA